MPIRIYLSVILLTFFFCLQSIAQADSISANENLLLEDVQMAKLKTIEDELNKLDQNLFANNFLIKEFTSAIDTLDENETKLISDFKNRIKQLELSNTNLQERRQDLHDELKTIAKPYPVVLFEDTLFYFYLSAGFNKASVRAKNTSELLFKIYDSRDFDSTLLKVHETELGLVVISYDLTLICVFSKMMDSYLKSPSWKLPMPPGNSIIQSITSNLEQTSLRHIIANVIQVTGLIILVFTIVWLLNKLVQPIKNLLLINRKKYIRPLRYRNTEIVDAHKMLEVAYSILNIVKWVLVISILYTGSFFIFSLFPNTKDISNQLISWIIGPIRDIHQGVVNFIPNLISIIVIFTAFRIFIRFIQYLSTQVTEKKIVLGNFPHDWARPTFSIVRFLLYALMFIIIFPFLPGSDSPAFQGVSVFLGLLISLGSSSTISNIISGIVITYMRPFRINEKVKVGEIIGTVVSKNLLVTKLRTIKNEDITIPNSNLLTGHILNYSSACEHIGLIVHTTVTIGYDVPWRKVHEALTDAILMVPSIEKNPPPFVYQTGLDDFYVAYQINAYTRDDTNLPLTNSQIHQSIQDVCNERGIEIMSPHYRNVRDGNMTTIPENYLAVDYEAPGFKIQKQEKNEE
ncbi:MAG: mechanosensitive ion channel [Bacteroidetes bacterium]|nr:mechanosensitive ion channel [Bacteroidota bacterium]